MLTYGQATLLAVCGLALMAFGPTRAQILVYAVVFFAGVCATQWWGWGWDWMMDVAIGMAFGASQSLARASMENDREPQDHQGEDDTT